jgi:cytochrome c oxidase accessory protein FixG
MCPWPRIQGALIDKEALSVTYRVDRGEPRGRHKKGESWEGRGDCIDCKACVAACPMGIDIRDGDQLECINCALCIDACDDIMDKIGRPRGLISYDSQDNVDRRARDEKPRYRFIRPRTVLYAILLAAVSGIMLFGLMNRSVLELNASRDRNPNYVRLSDGAVRNGYTLTVLNKSSQPRTYELTIEGDPAMSVRVLGADETSRQLEVGADQTQDFRLYVTLPRDAVDAPSEPLTFIVTDNETGEQAQTRSAFQTGESR